MGRDAKNPPSPGPGLLQRGRGEYQGAVPAALPQPLHFLSSPQALAGFARGGGTQGPLRTHSPALQRRGSHFNLHGAPEPP